MAGVPEIADEYLIHELTQKYANKVHIRGGMHGKNAKLLIEGHDISHMVTNMEVTSDPTDIVRIRLELVKVELS